MDAGIRQFRDILNEKGKLLTHIEIRGKFGIKFDFLAIGCIKSAVSWPKFWGSDIQTEAGYQLINVPGIRVWASRCTKSWQ